jgi:hypothetical protein
MYVATCIIGRHAAFMLGMSCIASSKEVIMIPFRESASGDATSGRVEMVLHQGYILKF